MAQRKRVGLITQRSEDRNLPPLLLEDRSLPPELFLVGVVGNISACHADAPGSIPGRGAFIGDGCIAQWQSSGLQIHGSPVRIRLYPSFLPWRHELEDRSDAMH